MLDTVGKKFARTEIAPRCGAIPRYRCWPASPCSRSCLPRYADFAGRLTLHARIEEEVSYPAALLVGEYLRHVLAAPLARGGLSDAVGHPAAADYNLSIRHGTW